MAPLKSDSLFSHTLQNNSVAGVDEVGRGCLAGPVFAAAVVLADRSRIANLRDSKKLGSAQRLLVDLRIRESALAWSIGRAEPSEIDQINILQATFLAMRRAVSGLKIPIRLCRVDGNQDPRLGIATELMVGGDDSEPCIMAASVVAKVARDQQMQALDLQYPGYGFAQNKGYGTPLHLAALNRQGPSPIHRLSFAPCARALGALGRDA